MLTREEYGDWWINGDSDGIESTDLIETLIYHVEALQKRLDKLLDPDQHDIQHNSSKRDCFCYLTQCACAFDYPTDVCSAHKKLLNINPENRRKLSLETELVSEERDG